MIATKGYAAQNAISPLDNFSFERRDPGPHDVQIEILYCGVCHSDLHQVRNDWGNSMYPMVPGHEIVGRVTRVGNHVTKLKEGDLAGVGCLVDSCRECVQCNEGLEQYCQNGLVGTYNSFERDGKTLTFGGYSKMIVTDERFVLKVSDKLPLPNVAPLLCAGITTYSPLRHWKVGKGTKVGIVGLGGLGHMGLKLARAFGAEVTMLSHTASKEADARRLGAHHFALTTDENVVKTLHNSLDFILDTVSAAHDYSTYINMLRTNGSLVCVGLPTAPAQLPVFPLVLGRRNFAGSLIGGLPETQEMLDFCAEHNISSDIELIAMKDINTAYDRLLKGDVRYRFVIDMATL